MDCNDRIEIPEFPGYTIDQYGSIYNKHGHQLSPELTSKGYHRISMRKDNQTIKKRIHRLVALAFIDNPNNYTEINHIDGNKTNNCVSNLEWCSRKTNMQHAANVLKVMNWTNEQKLKVKGLRRAAKLSMDDINDIKQELIQLIPSKGKWGYGIKIKEIAYRYNVTYQTIWMISKQIIINTSDQR